MSDGQLLEIFSAAQAADVITTGVAMEDGGIYDPLLGRWVAWSEGKPEQNSTR